MPPKPIQWVGSARYELRDFPDDARLDAGFALWAVQKGEEPPDSKPMPIIGKGTQEIRIRTTDAYRIFYVAKFEEAIYLYPPRIPKENPENVSPKYRNWTTTLQTTDSTT